MSVKIALAGNPNSGKTTLFNNLTGSNQFVGNWPGVTVEKKEGKLKKQYVKTGRSFYGYATEILEGLSVEDAITFPYGDGAVEGASVEITDDMGVFYQ